MHFFMTISWTFFSLFSVAQYPQLRPRPPHGWGF